MASVLASRFGGPWVSPLDWASRSSWDSVLCLTPASCCSTGQCFGRRYRLCLDDGCDHRAAVVLLRRLRYVDGGLGANWAQCRHHGRLAHRHLGSDQEEGRGRCSERRAEGPSARWLRAWSLSLAVGFGIAIVLGLLAGVLGWSGHTPVIRGIATRRPWARAWVRGAFDSRSDVRPGCGPERGSRDWHPRSAVRLDDWPDRTRCAEANGAEPGDPAVGGQRRGVRVAWLSVRGPALWSAQRVVGWSADSHFARRG